MKRGFTLIEVVGSVLILAGLIAIASQVTFGSFKRMKKSERIQIVTYLLKQKMSELEAIYKNDNILNLPSEDEGVFEEEPNYSWKFQTQSFKMPSALTLLAIQNAPQTDINIKIVNVIKEVLANTVVELKLTVTYMKANKSTDYSLVSYFVNYGDVPSYIQSTILNLLPSTDSPLNPTSEESTL